MKRPAAAFTRKRIAGKFAGTPAKRTSGKVKGTLIVRVRCFDSDDERKKKKNAKGLDIIPFRRIEMMEDATVKQLECRLLQLDLGYMPPPEKYDLFYNGLVLGVVRGVVVGVVLGVVAILLTGLLVQPCRYNCREFLASW